MSSVLNTLSEYKYFYISKKKKKKYFKHFCCLFLKLSKAFSVSLKSQQKFGKMMCPPEAVLIHIKKFE